MEKETFAVFLQVYHMRAKKMCTANLKESLLTSLDSDNKGYE